MALVVRLKTPNYVAELPLKQNLTLMVSVVVVVVVVVVIIIIIIKGEVHPTTCHEGVEGE